MPSKKTAIFWIRDGVLVDRMAFNAVAFAAAAMVRARCASDTRLFTDLINFAFETSGISCAEKLKRFNSEVSILVDDVPATVDFYNRLAASGAQDCKYFPGICDLVRMLNERGVLNFITSAVEQPRLDEWAETTQGQVLKPDLQEILGKRSESFCKGPAHFQYAKEKYGIERFLLIADAVSEIQMGAALADEFGVCTIGFAHHITREKIRQASSLVSSISPGSVALSFDDHRLLLPNEESLVAALKECKPFAVVSGNTENISAELRSCLVDCLFPGEGEH